MYSMTSFARATTNTNDRHLVWELKAGNHRFLETQFRLTVHYLLREFALPGPDPYWQVAGPAWDF